MAKSLVSGLIDVVEDIAYGVGSIFGAHSGAYCDIETSDGPDTLVTKSGFMLSGIEIRGINELVGPDEFESIVSNLDRLLSPIMAKPGHIVQFWFQRDTATTKDSLNATLSAGRLTAKRLNLALDDVFDSKVNHLSKYCSDEKLYIGLWTTPQVMSKQMQERAVKKKAGDMKKIAGSIRTGAQNLVAAVPEIREVHESMVEAIKDGLQETGFFCERLSAHNMLREIRRNISPSFTDFRWKPVLPGDKVPNVPRGEREADISEIGYPPVNWQVFPQDLERHPNNRYITCGDRVYAPVYIEIPPTEIFPFSKLFNLMSSSEIPWRISFMIESGGVASVSFKSQMASLLTWAGAYNRNITEAVDRLKEAKMEGVPDIKVRVSLCTWAPSDKVDLLQDRVSKLVKAATNWGQAEIREVSGDAMLGFASTLPFLTLRSPANHFAAPISDFVRMLPVDRLSSYWSHGAVLLRTMDGRIVPFEPGSSVQTTSNYLFFARPGMGKSVMMAAFNIGACVRSGMERLPYVSYLDIGPSSKGFTNLIQDALPAKYKHYAAHFKLRMSRDNAINAFDTQLGFRHPLPEEMSALVDLLTTIATPAENDRPYDSVSALASKVITEAYNHFSDGTKSKPKIYTAGVAPNIDEAVSLYGFEHDKTTSWWEVVDFLFSKGETHLAVLAQRFAVPTIEDIAAIARTPAISDLYSDMTISTGEKLSDAFSRLLVDSIRDLPVLSGETRFDIGEARIIAIDLNDVAKDGGPSSRRQAAIMYMLARFVAMRHFKLHEDMLSDVPPLYKSYYRTKVEEVQQTMKWIVYDEFHRTSFSPLIRNQVVIDMREGRKWNLGVMLASQSIADFDEQIREFATGVFILNAGTKVVAEELKKIFGFNDTSKRMLLQHANGPTAKGTPFLAQFMTKKGSSSQFLVLSISPIEVWALSTTPEDVAIRSALYQRIGAAKARALLAKEFPGGTAKDAIERIREDMNEDDENMTGAIQKIVKDLLNKYNL